MGSKKKEAKKAAEDAREKAHELKEQAREVAGLSGEALKEFASKTKDAAKELVDQIEKAAKESGIKEEPKKSRKVLKATLAIGAGIAVLSNEKAREAIKSVISRAKGGSDQPEVWRPDARPAHNGDQKKTTASSIAEETS